MNGTPCIPKPVSTGTISWFPSQTVRHTGNLVPRCEIVLLDVLKHTQRQDEQVPFVRVRPHLPDLDPQGHAAIVAQGESSDDDSRGRILSPSKVLHIEFLAVVVWLAEGKIGA